MSVSQNGFSILASAQTKHWNVPHCPVSFDLRDGACGFVLTHFIGWFAAHVEPLAGGADDFGYSLRRIAGTDEWSNHASGTAVDLNAAQHPYGAVGTFSLEQAAAIRARLSSPFSDVIRWGGDYRGSKDEMHFEINASPLAVRHVAARLRRTPLGVLIRLTNRKA